MDVSLASWLVIAVALVAANLPFFNERVFGFLPLKPAAPATAAVKPFWARLLELISLYLAVGLLARLLEGAGSDVYQQSWEFYWINGFMFLVLAFPGFVLRYLRKHRH